MDANGYPEDDELEEVRSLGLDFRAGCDRMAELFEATGYSRGYGYLADGSFELHTGGWSGCEDLIDAASDSIWWLRYWHSTTRGGHYLFKED